MARFMRVYNVQVRHYKPIVVIQDWSRHGRVRRKFRFRTIFIITSLLFLLYIMIGEICSFSSSELLTKTFVLRLVSSTGDSGPDRHVHSVRTLNLTNKISRKKTPACNRAGWESVWTTEPEVKYTFGAVAGHGDQSDQIVVISLYHFAATKQSVVCCYSDFREPPQPLMLPIDGEEFQPFFTKNELSFRSTTCLNHMVPNKSLEYRLGITTVLADKACPTNNDAYVLPYSPPEAPEGSVALCAKIVYKSPDKQLLIEWMEAQRYLGVSKVVLYVDYTTTAPVRDVLSYYERTGFLETRPYIQAGIGTQFEEELSNVTRQTTANKLVAIWQCVASLSGYSYVGILDLDEFIIPSRGRTIPQLMNDLVNENPIAAGFAFATVYHMTSWEASDDPDGIFLSRYRLHTKKMALLDRRKHIFLPNRIQFGGALTTHTFTALDGYSTEKVRDSEAVLHHFRKCRHNRLRLADNLLCENEAYRTVDNEYLAFVENIRHNILSTNVQITPVCSRQ